MTMTKKEIYAQYGIIYEDNHIWFIDRWICELLKEGNSKTGKRVYTWSMLAGINGTCVGTCEGCYAMTGRYKTKTVIESNTLNTEIATNHIDFFYNAISAQLEIIGEGEVRIHASGDFNTKNSEEYANTWLRIVNEHKNILFWTYTKIKKYETLFDNCNNANIVKSIIDGVGFNFGHCDYIIKVYNMLKKAGKKVYICRCGIDKNQHCQNCRHCATSEFVLFIEHSTDYVAVKDPAYAELKALIDSQDN